MIWGFSPCQWWVSKNQSLDCGWVGGWIELDPVVFGDFWNCFNFAKPLMSVSISSLWYCGLLQTTMRKICHQWREGGCLMKPWTRRLWTHASHHTRHQRVRLSQWPTSLAGHLHGNNPFTQVNWYLFGKVIIIWYYALLFGNIPSYLVMCLLIW